MSELERALAADLDRLAPPENDAAADWLDVVRRVRGRRSPRRGAVLAVAAAALCIGVALPALALSSGLRRALGLEEHPRPVLAEARLLVEGPAGNGKVARVFEAPNTRGGTCWFVELARAGSPRRARSSNGGGVCSVGPRSGGADAPGIVWSLSGRPRTRDNAAGWMPPLLHGRVDARLRAAQVVLEWSGGSKVLRFANDNFLLVSPILYRPPRARLPYELVAYDARGREVARRRIPKEALAFR